MEILRVWVKPIPRIAYSNHPKKLKSQAYCVMFVDSVTRFGNLSPFWQFLEAFGDNFFCLKSPIYKSFDEDILGFEKFIYLLWQQIWQFLPKCC